MPKSDAIQIQIENHPVNKFNKVIENSINMIVYVQEVKRTERQQEK